MSFAEKLRTLRKQAGMSQEKLAEKLSVSRQAITKWETDTGIPDIENIMAISALFDVSIDELLSNDKGARIKDDYACLHHISPVCEHHAGENCHDAADKMRGDHCRHPGGGIGGADK